MQRRNTSNYLLADWRWRCRNGDLVDAKPDASFNGATFEKEGGTCALDRAELVDVATNLE